MTKLMGLGPVFAFEWLMTARRWQTYAMRSATVLFLLLALWLVWGEQAGRSSDGEMSIPRQTEVARSFFGTTAMLLLGLVGLAAPASAAGSICEDKARGNLALLFATDLSSAEIVLGKLGARLVPVLSLILCAAPVLSIALMFGGVDPAGLLGVLFVILACAIFGCTLALTLSVWGRKTHEVLIVTYVFGILYLLAAPLVAFGAFGRWPSSVWPSWFPSFLELLRYNPVVLVVSTHEGPAPGMRPITFGTFAAFLALALAVSSGLAGVAIWRIRRVVIRQMGQGRRARRTRPSIVSLASDLYRRFVPGPSLDGNPVLWRECRRKAPSRWGLAITAIYVLFGGGGTVYAISLLIENNRAGTELGLVVNALLVAFGLLMLGVSAATSLSEERQMGSLDVLMATPLSTRSIVWGKWWGTFRSVKRMMILPLVLTFALSFRTGHVWGVVPMFALILAYASAITSLGLALATWVSRMGRAVGTTVGLYTFMCLAWIPLSFILFGGRRGDAGNGIASGSPLMGVAQYSSLLAGDGLTYELADQTVWTIFWTLAYGGVAVALLMATLGTFNRSLGRVDEASLAGDDASTGLSHMDGETEHESI